MANLVLLHLRLAAAVARVVDLSTEREVESVNIVEERLCLSCDVNIIVGSHAYFTFKVYILQNLLVSLTRRDHVIYTRISNK